MTEIEQTLLEMRVKQTLIKLCKKLFNQIEDPATDPGDRVRLLDLLRVTLKSV